MHVADLIESDQASNHDALARTGHAFCPATCGVVPSSPPHDPLLVPQNDRRFGNVAVKGRHGLGRISYHTTTIARGMPAPHTLDEVDTLELQSALQSGPMRCVFKRASARFCDSGPITSIVILSETRAELLLRDASITV